jgi:nitroreductase
VRKYQDKRVGDADIDALLEAARWAPSWANTQCWRLVVVRNSARKSELADTLAPGNPATEAVRTAPVVLVACAQRGLAGFKGGAAVTDKGDWFMFDVALAIHNVTLAAHALGLGTVHVGLFNAQRVAQILEVPEAVAVVEILPVGYPEGTPKLTSRMPVAEFVFHERYGSKRIQRP